LVENIKRIVSSIPEGKTVVYDNHSCTTWHLNHPVLFGTFVHTKVHK